QISTYDADFTLIPEYDLERALECLSNVFTISNNPLEDLGLQPSDLESWRTSYPLNPGGDVKSIQDTLLLETDVSDKLNISSLSSNQSVNHTTLNHGLKSIKARHPFNANYSCRLHITSMEQSLMGMLAIRLLESIFFDSRMERFFSFTQTDTTMSIIMDDATMSLFPEHTLNTHAGDWRLIAIGDGPLGFDECGVVSEYSRPLSENGIGLFYMSTFRSDYIMVNDHDFERAVSHLHKIAKEISPPVMDSQQDEEEGEENNQAMMTHFSSDSDSVSVSDSDSSSDADSASEVDPDEHDMNAKHGYDHDDDLEIVFVDESIPT
ncbi:GATS protein-like 3, partial [Lobosporangium transversale]